MLDFVVVYNVLNEFLIHGCISNRWILAIQFDFSLFLLLQNFKVLNIFSILSSKFRPVFVYVFKFWITLFVQDFPKYRILPISSRGSKICKTKFKTLLSI